jgi:hypothetical protein
MDPQVEKVLECDFDSIVNALLYVLEAEYVDQEDIVKSRTDLEYLRKAIDRALQSVEIIS